MARATEMETLSNRRSYQYTVEFSGETESLSDYFFGFLSDEALQTPDSSAGSGDGWDDNLEEDESCQSSDQRRAFWESQDQIIQSMLYRTTLVEANVRRATRESLQELSSGGFRCSCRIPVTGDCRSCLREEVCQALTMKGFRCSICKSKWRSSSEILAGEHIFLEVVDGSNPKKGDIRVIIELNFRAEFEMARSGNEYRQLIGRLPEFFVGKEDRLRLLIKALCVATKRCLEEMKIHIGPWRKHKYMQAKWLGKCQRLSPVVATPLVISGRPERARASTLTFDDLGNKLSGLSQCNAVEVL